MGINDNKEFIVNDKTIDSKKLKKQHKKLFEKKLSTQDGYQEVVDSLNLAESLVSEENRKYLELYRIKLLKLCSDKKYTLCNTEVKQVISDSNNKFIDVFGEKGKITNSREYRSALIDTVA